MANLQINASLNINKTLANIVDDVDKKINPQIQANSKARVKLVGSLDISKTIKTINANFQNINKDLKVQIGNVSFAPINTAQLQNNINQATQNVKPTITIAPILDRSAFKDTESYINEIINRLSNPNIANNINFNTMLKGLKESFGLANKDIKTELTKKETMGFFPIGSKDYNKAFSGIFDGQNNIDYQNYYGNQVIFLPN